MKRIWKSLMRPAKNRNYQQDAIKYAEEMEQSGAVRRAPRYPTEEKHFRKIREDKKIAEEIRRRNDVLVDNMNKITITSSEPEDRWTPTKDLPSKDTEWVHRNDELWEFGFSEPPPEKIPKGKLTFREALEVLRARCDQTFVLKLDEKRREVLLPQILESLEKHPAVQRVDKEDLDTLWQYFRPFERKETQYVVRKKDIEELQDAMLGFHKEPRIPTLEDVRKKREQELEPETLLRLEGTLSEEEKEKAEKLKKTKELKLKEDARLSQELKKLGLTNESKDIEEAKDSSEKRRLEQVK